MLWQSKPKTTVTRPEQDLQRAMLTKLFREYPQAFVFHVNNNAAKGRKDGYIAKLNGVKAGVPDLVVVRPHARIGWLEIKTSAGVTSLAQKRVHAIWKKLRHDVYVVRNLDDLGLIIDNWKKEDQEQNGVGRLVQTSK